MKKEDSTDREDCRKKGNRIRAWDSGGRFGRDPSILWNEYECLNHPVMCARCIYFEKPCKSSGNFSEMYVMDSNGDYQKSI